MTPTSPTIASAAVRDLALLFAALAEPARVRILLILAERGECGPAELAEELGLAAPTVSYHLAELRLHGLIAARRQHKRLFYRLTASATAAESDPALLSVRNDGASVRVVCTTATEAIAAQPGDPPHTDQTLRNFLRLIDQLAPLAPAAAALRYALQPTQRDGSGRP